MQASSLEVDQAMTREDKEWISGPPKNNSSYRIIQIGSTLVEILKQQKYNQKNNKLKYGEFYKKEYFEISDDDS